MNECVSLFYDLFLQRHNPFLKGYLCFVVKRKGTINNEFFLRKIMITCFFRHMIMFFSFTDKDRVNKNVFSLNKKNNVL